MNTQEEVQKQQSYFLHLKDNVFLGVASFKRKVSALPGVKKQSKSAVASLELGVIGISTRGNAEDIARYTSDTSKDALANALIAAYDEVFGEQSKSIQEDLQAISDTLASLVGFNADKFKSKATEGLTPEKAVKIRLDFADTVIQYYKGSGAKTAEGLKTLLVAKFPGTEEAIKKGMPEIKAVTLTDSQASEVQKMADEALQTIIDGVENFRKVKREKYSSVSYNAKKSILNAAQKLSGISANLQEEVKQAASAIKYAGFTKDGQQKPSESPKAKYTDPVKTEDFEL